MVTKCYKALDVTRSDHEMIFDKMITGSLIDAFLVESSDSPEA